jgi:hypothetical protein
MEYRYREDNTIELKPKPEYYGLTEDKVRNLEVYYKDPYNYRPTDKNKYQPGFFANLVYLIIWGTIIYLVSGWRRGNIELVPILIFLIMALIIYYGYSKMIAYINRISDVNYLGELTEKEKIMYQLYKEELTEYNKLKLIIKWENIQFVDGAIELTRIDIRKTYSFPFDCKSEYSQYIYSLMDKFPEVQMHYENRKPCLSNPNVIDECIEIIVTYIEKKKEEEKKKLEDLLKSHSYLRVSYERQQQIRVSLQNSRSQYLKYLFENQAKGKNIIEAFENPVFTNYTSPLEKAYIFTLAKPSGGYSIIFENATVDSNASIVCEADDEDYFDCIGALYNFMRGKTINKRQTLRQTHEIDEFETKSVNHKDFYSWKNQLMGLHRQVYIKRRRRKKRSYYRRW